MLSTAPDIWGRATVHRPDSPTQPTCPCPHKTSRARRFYYTDCDWSCALHNDSVEKISPVRGSFRGRSFYFLARLLEGGNTSRDHNGCITGIATRATTSLNRSRIISIFFEFLIADNTFFWRVFRFHHFLLAWVPFAIPPLYKQSSCQRKSLVIGKADLTRLQNLATCWQFHVGIFYNHHFSLDNAGCAR
mgnify:CR=1 FL=1